MNEKLQRLKSLCEDLLTIDKFLNNLQTDTKVALLDKEGNVVEPDLADEDSRDKYGDMTLSKAGDGAMIMDGEFEGGSIKFHTGDLG